jgi:ribonuclease BN (tRNA processing enzyme)
MRFVTLGVGDAFSARWYSSSVAVEHDGAWLLVDCAHPIRKVLREAGAGVGIDLDVGTFRGVILTHLHADHASGVEGFAYYSRMVLGRAVPLLAHPDVHRELWEYQLGATMGRRGRGTEGTAGEARRREFFEIIDLREESAVGFGPFTIECRRTLHSIPTFALRIRAGGRTLGLSADTAFDPDLIAWLDAADLIVHETNHAPHTPYEALAALEPRIRTKMRLIHYPDTFDTAGSVIEPLVQGRIQEV